MIKLWMALEMLGAYGTSHEQRRRIVQSMDPFPGSVMEQIRVDRVDPVARVIGMTVLWYTLSDQHIHEAKREIHW